MSSLLLFLLQDIGTLPGVGIKRRPFYNRLMGGRVVDALWLLPTHLHYRYHVQTLTTEYIDRYVTLKVKVQAHYPSLHFRQPYRVNVVTQTQQKLELTFFHARAAYLNRLAPPGQPIIISGKLTAYKKSGIEQWQMVHPDHMGTFETLDQWLGVERHYPLTAGLNQGMVRSVIDTVLNRLTQPTEWLDETLVKQQGWPNWLQALKILHHPQTSDDLEISSPARQRLIYDEILAHQLSLHLTHRQKVKLPAPELKGTGYHTYKLLKNLPFALTSCQEEAFKQISQDLQKPYQTLRLLQGDVGSGKTIIALLAALQAIESGYQSTLLAPTDILARQHYHSLEKLTQPLGINIALLTAREKGKVRQHLLQQLETGKIDLLIGTHAIIQNTIRFSRLGLAIIDEQHRFGVEQRLALSDKGLNPHILSMTATPIPRTLMLANYGDLDISLLKQKPPGRQPITTSVMSLDRLKEVLNALATVMISGQKIYWVCPLVEESETLDLAAVTERYQFLSKKFPGQVALIHGRMKSQEKELVMFQFVQGDANILVATTVIEVGIDVPAATIMVIEHAERFGLSQLHQLRGRVGRGQNSSSCLLLYGQPLTTIARKRLAIMRESNDGFAIAEADLKLRGGGEILGTRQSGLPKFRFFDLNTKEEDVLDTYADFFAKANNEAKQILSSDPSLQSERGKALQFLLSLFSQEDAVKYRRSG